MKHSLIAICLAGILSLSPGRATARWGSNDVVPSATLLMPWFEIDTTSSPLASSDVVAGIVNTAALAVMVRVTLWTDEGVPSFAFNIYLTGFDMELISLRQLFAHGLLPVTADDGNDLNGDVISPQGPMSQDVSYGCASGPARLDEATRSALVEAHGGRASTLFGGLCGATAAPAGIVRGYVTLDTIATCNGLKPGDAAYFTGTATAQNQLTGFFEQRDAANNSAYGDDLVHIEARVVGNTPGTPTFYGRLVGWNATDGREPIGPRWRARFVAGGAIGHDDILVWRDAAGPVVPFACGSPPAGALMRRALVWDEQEQVTDLGTADVLPAVAQRLTLGPSTGAADRSIGALVPYQFGAIDLDLRAPAGATGGPASDPTFRNSMVIVRMLSAGRFGVSAPAWRLPPGGL